MKKILVIEDDKDLLSLLKTLLEKNGFKVEGLNNGVNANKVIRKVKPNLILMDYYLTNNKNGDEVCNEIKKFFNIPILMFSASSHLKANELCADEFISKPFEVLDLIERIKKMTGGKQKP